jgi:hypothetical protein
LQVSSRHPIGFPRVISALTGAPQPENPETNFCAQAEEIFMSDFQPTDLVPASGPACPLCGGETCLTQMHKAVAAAMNVFRCRVCNVEYPVVKKDAEGTI